MAKDVATSGKLLRLLAAALQLGKTQPVVVVIDDGQPLTASPAARSVPGWDGVPPAEILNRFRTDLSAYPTVQLLKGRIKDLQGEIDGSPFTQASSRSTPATRNLAMACGTSFLTFRVCRRLGDGRSCTAPIAMAMR